MGAVVLVTLPEALRFVGMPSSVAANMRQILYGSPGGLHDVATAGIDGEVFVWRWAQRAEDGRPRDEV